jgi:cell division protein FtsI/penicillin-binding protein 2
MGRPTHRSALKLLLAAGLLGAGVGLFSAGGSNEGSRAVAQEGEQPDPSRLLKGFDPRVHRADGDRRVADLPEGRRAILTLDPGLQSHVLAELARYEVPYGALVAIEPGTGRVLAYVSHSTANPDAGDLALDPTPPAASVFKVITGAALVDAGVAADTRVCYGGGFSRLTAADLVDNPRRDRQCSTLSEAMGSSINAVFAKLAAQHLDTATLTRYASAFGFGHALPFDVSTRPSPMEVPDHGADQLEFARTSAGFWHTHLSPLHGALIAATIAKAGRMPRAAIVDHIVDAGGETIYRREARTYRQVIPRRTARILGEMMERTVRAGTARRAFHDPSGRPFLPDIRVAGKTGTLSGSSPYRGYTWWIGFAPAEQPTIALAALVVNTPRWRIKASYLAREALRHYLIERPRRLAAEQRLPAPGKQLTENL